MYYLLKPDTTVWESDLPDVVVNRLVSENPGMAIDLGKLEWARSNRRFDAGLLNIALRTGIPAGDGLIVSAGSVVPLDYYRQMAVIHEQEQRRDSTDVPHADLMESVMPGWTERTRETDERVETSQAQTVDRAKQDLARVLNAPVSDFLAEHWQNLGGGLPPAVPPDSANRL